MPRLVGLLAEDRDPHLVVGRLHIGDQPTLEAGAHPVFEGGNRARRPVAGDDDLLAVLVERVEGVEELLLGALLAGDELDVVDHQDVDAAVAGAEVVHPARSDVVDDIVGERFGGDVHDRQVGVDLERAVTDRVQEVRFAETDPAVHEERIELAAGMIGNGQGGGMGEPVRAADDVGVEGERGN